ncbi:MAG: TonB-dependent receptor [Ferruginibacter sp.]
MRKLFLLLFATLYLFPSIAQSTFKTIVRDKTSGKVMSNVTIMIQNGNAGIFTDQNGFAEFAGFSNGPHVFTFSHTGYEKRMDTLQFPLAVDTVQILMEHGQELEEVIVQSVRTSRTIMNTPTRIETIDGEELDEKNNMRPANVSMLLHESTGLQVQQTSATSGNASIRIQGLDGRYTQLLKDGYPNFGNFASGLSILEIPPLDLRQVEVIKGPASTLYGGGAIAGVVNFISKTPGEEQVVDILFNQSNIGQTNVGAYLSKRKGKLGYALLSLFNFQKAYDVDKDDFSELPDNKNYTINPRIFFYPNPSITIMIGNSFTKGNMKGGDMKVIDGKQDSSHTYFEKNVTLRNTSTIEVDKRFAEKSSLKLKQSISIFNREINIPNYTFAGSTINSYTDLSMIFFKKKHTIITGLDLVLEKFDQKHSEVQNNHSSSVGGYFQDSWDLDKKIKIETGLRIDNVSYKNINYSKNQTFVLPRISVLVKITDKIVSRVGAGLGYKIPTIFTEQTESIQYRNVLPLDNVTAERSYGGTADVNYKKNLGSKLNFIVNQMFFYTSIINPLELQSQIGGNYFFANTAKPIITNGFETNIKFIFKENLKLFVGYTFTNAKAMYLPINKQLPLLPRNKLNLTLMYEKEDNFKLGLESYFTGSQHLYNGTKTPGFWEFGFAAQKTIKKISVFINFENFTDERQSKYKPVVNPPHNNPTFDDIWNHTEGFVLNGGVKLKL